MAKVLLVECFHHFAMCFYPSVTIFFFGGCGLGHCHCEDLLLLVVNGGIVIGYCPVLKGLGWHWYQLITRLIQSVNSQLNMECYSLVITTFGCLWGWQLVPRCQIVELKQLHIIVRHLAARRVVCAAILYET